MSIIEILTQLDSYDMFIIKILRNLQSEENTTTQLGIKFKLSIVMLHFYGPFTFQDVNLNSTKDLPHLLNTKV